MSNLDFTTPEYARGKRAYEGYAEATGGKTYDGRDMPQWRDLGEQVQRAWIAAAASVVSFISTAKKRV